MAAAESALVPITQEDTVDAILRKIDSTNATFIQLLVPHDTPALQAPRGFERLRRALDADGIELQVITSDEQTLAAARRNGIEALGVTGTRVLPGNVKPTRFTTQVLPEIKINERDAAFLNALDNVPAESEEGDSPDGTFDDELYAAIDDASEEAGTRQPSNADDDYFADQLDEYANLSTAETVAARTPLRDQRNRDAEQARGYGDDYERAGGRRASAQRERDHLRDEMARETLARRRTGGRPYRETPRGYARPRRTATALLPVVLLVIIVAVGGFWLWNSSAAIAVSPPPTEVRETAFQNQIIPLTEPNAPASDTAVIASPVSATAETTVSGQVTREVSVPSGTASGTVSIINTSEVAVPLAQGTEFIATNERGDQVRFTIDAPATIPAAVTTSSISGRSTTYGTLDAKVTARSPGSASNVGENAIKQILVPGQQPITTDQGSFLLRNAPISGGSEASQRVVTEDEVNAILGAALTQLFDASLQQLRAQIDESKLGIDTTTIQPSPAELGKQGNYEVVDIKPPLGSTVDAANPSFTVTVRAAFNALATPRDRTVLAQLQNNVAASSLAQRKPPPCKPAEQQGTRLEAVVWDGQRLTISGVVSCTPPGGLQQQTLALVREAVRGQTREAADKGLQSLQEQGLIGTYELPDRASFPQFDWLITVNTAAATPESQPTAEPQPTIEPQPTEVVQPVQGTLS